MSGSNRKTGDSVEFTDFLKAADESRKIVDDHVVTILREVMESKGMNPDDGVDNVLTTGVALNLFHASFTLLLSQQLLGDDVEHTDDAMALATGLMNLAANQVMLRVPGIGEKISEAMANAEAEAKSKLH